MGLGKWKSKSTASTGAATPGAPSNSFVSRKQQRKDAKKLKKLQNLAFSKRQKVEKVIAETLRRDDDISKKKRKRKAKKERKLQEEASDSEEELQPEPSKRRKEDDSDSDSDADLTYEQYLKEVEEKKRERLSDADTAQDDDIAIHRYTKLLGLDKRKAKTVPKSFCDEGLDSLLEFCDAENRKELISKEENLDIKGADIHDEEEEESGSEGEPEIDLSEGENDGEDSDLMDEEEMFDEEEMEDEEGLESEEEEGVNVAEDIYGRRVDKRTGELIKFDPKGARRKLEELESKKGDDETRLKIDRTITGIINRLSEATLVKSKQMFMDLWNSNPKNDVKGSLSKVMWKMMGAPYRLQDSLISTYSLFLGIIHATIGSEISAFFAEEFLVDYVALIEKDRVQDDKSMENQMVLICNLANFRIIRPSVLIELIDKLLGKFTIDNLQLLLALGTYAYKTMKRNCWTTFSDKITDALNKLQAAPIGAAPRAKFLGEQLASLKKTAPPSVDLSATEHHQKMLHGLLKKEKGEVEKELGMGLEDLLKADERGRWWVVGSAFRLENDSYSGIAQNISAESSSRGPVFPQDLLDLAAKAKMNTVVRRNIFCTIASASDEDEAFEKLLRLSLKGQQEREIIIVIVQMMLKEKQFNAYYPTLVARFCSFDRRFILTTQYAIWDRVREVGTLKPKGRNHLAQFIYQLVHTEVMHITVLKVVEWGTLDAATSSMLRRVFSLLAECPPTKLKRILQPILDGKKDPVLTEGLRLFLQVNFPSTVLYQQAENWFCGL